MNEEYKKLAMEIASKMNHFGDVENLFKIADKIYSWFTGDVSNDNDKQTGNKSQYGIELQQ